MLSAFALFFAPHAVGGLLDHIDFNSPAMSQPDTTLAEVKKLLAKGASAGADLREVNVLGLDESGADMTSTDLQNMISGESALMELSKANNLSRAWRDK